MAPPERTRDQKEWTSLVLNKEVGGLKARRRKGTNAKKHGDELMSAFSNAPTERPPWAWNSDKGAKPVFLDESQPEINKVPVKHYLEHHDHPSRPEGWAEKSNADSGDWTIFGIPGKFETIHQGVSFPCTPVMEAALQSTGTDKDKGSAVAVADTIWNSLSDSPLTNDTTKTVVDVAKDPGCLFIMKRIGGDGIEELDKWIFVWYLRRQYRVVENGKARTKWIRFLVAPRNEHIVEMYNSKLPDLLSSVLEDPLTKLFRKTIHKAFFSYKQEGGLEPSDTPIEWEVTYPVYPISLIWNAWCERMYPACIKKKSESADMKCNDPEPEANPIEASDATNEAKKNDTAESHGSPKIQMTLSGKPAAPEAAKPKRKYQRKTAAPAAKEKEKQKVEEPKPKAKRSRQTVQAEETVSEPPVKKQRVAKPAPKSNRKRPDPARFNHSDLNTLESSFGRCKELIGKLEKSGQTSGAKIDLFSEWSSMTAQTKSFLLSLQWVCNEHSEIGSALTGALSQMRKSLPAEEEEQVQEQDDDADMALLQGMFDSKPKAPAKPKSKKPEAKPVVKRKVARKRFIESEAEEDDCASDDEESESESDNSLGGFVVADSDEESDDASEDLGSLSSDGEGAEEDGDGDESEDEDEYSRHVSKMLSE